MSRTWDQRAQSVLAQGCLTYSKRSDQFIKGVYPTHIDLGRGSTLYRKRQDGDYDMWTDWNGGLGSNIMDIDNNFSLPTKLEVEVAEMVRKRIPTCQKLRILKTGSEACQAAVRIARAYRRKKGRTPNRIGMIGVGYGYHGAHNWCVAAEQPGAGCESEGYFKAEGIDALLACVDKHKSILSYVIIEPVILDYSPAHIRKLRKLRELCTKHGIVLIHDEVVTGFRWPDYCVTNHYGLDPDIICLGKAAANGYPFAVVGGKRKIMDTPDWFISSTFAGEMETLRHAKDTMETLTPERLSELWHRGIAFHKRFNAISKRVQLHGYPTRSIFQGTEADKALFMQEMCKRGHLVGKAWSILFSHNGGQIDSFMKCAKEVLDLIDKGKVKLEGEMPQPVFKRY